MEAKVTIEEMKASGEKAIATMRECLERNHTIVLGVITLPDGTIGAYTFEPDCMGDWRLKSMLMLTLVVSLLEHEGTMFTLTADSYYSESMPDEVRRALPDSMAEWPESLRKEAIICWINAPGRQGICGTLRYTRQDGKLVFQDKVEWLSDTYNTDQARMVSRFHLDMTVEPEAVMLQILMKGQTGEVETPPGFAAA